MNLPQDSIIRDEKLTQYLLVPKIRNDKSKWLKIGGYSLNNWKRLQIDIRNQILTKEATFIEANEYGNLYEINAVMKTPNSKELRVSSIWMKEKLTNKTKFITMYPTKKENNEI